MLFNRDFAMLRMREKTWVRNIPDMSMYEDTKFIVESESENISLAEIVIKPE